MHKKFASLLILISKSTPHYSFAPSFSKYLNLQARINKIVNAHSVNYHHSPSGLTSKIQSLLFSIAPLGLHLSSEFLFGYIPSMSEKIPEFMMFRLLENALTHLKNKSRHFYSCRPLPRTKLSPRFLPSSHRGKLLILPGSRS